MATEPAERAECTEPLDGTEPSEPSDVADAAARRRLDDVFGDVAPSVTSDELGLDEPVRDTRAADEELLANRPPHHDRD